MLNFYLTQCTLSFLYQWKCKSKERLMAARKKTAAKKGAAKKGATAKKRTGAKATKRTAVKRAVKRTTTAKKSTGNVSVGRKAFTKSQFIATICSQTGLARRDVVGVLDSIGGIINAHVQKQGPETFAWPGMFKIQVIKKPATKARQGVNPFTGETMMFKAKPASRRIKIRPLKQLKAMAA
jgi:nucleoid DNA-binding protein